MASSTDAEAKREFQPAFQLAELSALIEAMRESVMTGCASVVVSTVSPCDVQSDRPRATEVRVIIHTSNRSATGGSVRLGEGDGRLTTVT